MKHRTGICFGTDVCGLSAVIFLNGSCFLSMDIRLLDCLYLYGEYEL